MESVRQALSFRPAERSFVDYSFAAALSRASCELRPPNVKEWCRKLTTSGFLGSAPNLDRPAPDDPVVQARVAAAMAAMSKETDACRLPVAAPLPPLGWSLPRDSASQMRCLAAALAIPALLKRDERTPLPPGKGP